MAKEKKDGMVRKVFCYGEGRVDAYCKGKRGRGVPLRENNSRFWIEEGDSGKTVDPYRPSCIADSLNPFL